MCKKMIEIDNCYIPDGYEVIEFRKPVTGDEYLHPEKHRVNTCYATHSTPKLILKKKEEWVDAEKVFSLSCRYRCPLVRHFDTKKEYSLIAVTVKGEAIVETRNCARDVHSIPLSCLEYKKEC